MWPHVLLVSLPKPHCPNTKSRFFFSLLVLFFQLLLLETLWITINQDRDRKQERKQRNRAKPVTADSVSDWIARGIDPVARTCLLLSLFFLSINVGEGKIAERLWYSHPANKKFEKGNNRETILPQGPLARPSLSHSVSLVSPENDPGARTAFSLFLQYMYTRQLLLGYWNGRMVILYQVNDENKTNMKILWRPRV